MESEPDYKEDVEKLRGFLESFREDDIDGTPQVKYMVILQMVANRREKMVHIDLDDVYEALGDEIGDRMKDNTKRYQRLLADAIDEVMPDPTDAQLEDADKIAALVEAYVRLVPASALRGGGGGKEEL